MKEMQIPTKLISLVKMTMEELTAVITTLEGQCDTLKVERKLRQGDSLPTVLLNIALEDALRALKYQGTLVKKLVQIIEYADYLAIVVRPNGFTRDLTRPE